MSALRLVQLSSGQWLLVAAPAQSRPARRESPRPAAPPILTPALAGGATCR